jgi:hypothetical protein
MTKGFDEVEQYSVIESSAPAAPEPPVDDKIETVPQEPAAEEPGDSLDPALVAEAKQYGFSESDLEGMAPERIGAILAAIDRRAVELMDRQGQPLQQRTFQSQQQQSPFMQQPPQQGFPGVQPGWQQPALPPPQYFPQMVQQGTPKQPQFELKINEAEWDPDLVKTIKGMHEWQQQQIAQLNQALQTQQMWYQSQLGSLQAQQEAQYTAWFDGKLSELGDEYHSVFGKGSGDSLRIGSAEHSARLRLNDALNRVAQLYPHASDDDLFSRALRMEFGNLSDQLSRQKASAQVANRSKQTIGRPGRKSGRTTDTLDPVTGFKQSLIDEVQQEIDAKMQGAH